MKLRKLVLDLKNINDLSEFHEMMKKKFGFPDFYGANINALIDCLSLMRYPKAEMCKFILQPDEILLLETTGLYHTNDDILGLLIYTIECVNSREIERNEFKLPSIYLSCIRNADE